MNGKIIGAVLGGVGLVAIPAAAFATGALPLTSDEQTVTDEVTLTSRDRDRDQDCDGECELADGQTRGMRSGDNSAVLDLVDGELSDDDAEALAFMAEEEKLAHDLYAAFAEEWDLRIFEQIASAETRHTESVASVLEAYGLDDPTEGNDVGEFTDPDLQELYDDLLERGLTSEEEALAVGALVEETDIQDLRDRDSEDEAVSLLFEQLEQASANHLRAFIAQLDRLGVEYEPQVLSDDELAELADEATGRGMGAGMSMRNGQSNADDAGSAGNATGDQDGDGSQNGRRAGGGTGDCMQDD